MFPNYLSECVEDLFYVNLDCALDSDDPYDPDCVVKPKDYNELKKRFLFHFLRGDYKQCLMKELSKRKHRSDESILSYLTSIKAICHDLDKKMSSEQKISYIIEGLDDETAAQITYFNPQSVPDLERIARNIEQGRELLHKSKPDIAKNKRVNAIQVQTSSFKHNKNESKGNDNVLEAITKLNESLNAFAITKTYKENDKFKKDFKLL
jgi:Cft2 family RNA processing exonuclease